MGFGAGAGPGAVLILLAFEVVGESVPSGDSSSGVTGLAVLCDPSRDSVVLSASARAEPRSSDPLSGGSSSIDEANLCVGESSSIGSISVLSFGVAKRRNQM